MFHVRSRLLNPIAQSEHVNGSARHIFRCTCTPSGLKTSWRGASRRRRSTSAGPRRNGAVGFGQHHRSFDLPRGDRPVPVAAADLSPSGIPPMHAVVLLCALGLPYLAPAGLQAGDRSSSIEPSPVRLRTRDGGTVHGDLYGSGTRGLVLAHGGRFTKGSWAKQVPELLGAGFRVLAIDFRGFGESRADAQAQPAHHSTSLPRCTTSGGKAPRRSRSSAGASAVSRRRPPPSKSRGRLTAL